MLGWSRPGRAAEQPFGSPPAAWVGPVENTQGIALGDIDGDGRLDLVRGNSLGQSTLYLNTDTLFARNPVWSGRGESTFSVAVGDVNGDGNLDLVRGNNGRQTTLYLGRNGSFDATPAWAGPAEFTLSVALGDVDGDGRPDLVCGNRSGGSTLYRNVGGTFDPAPAWRGPDVSTSSVVLGDIDGDGDLDLVCGTEHGATLYLNTAGHLDSVAVWSGPDEVLSTVRLGDVDGDGRLDLVCGTVRGAELFLNAGAGFGSSPVWRGLDEEIPCLTLGDVDGDGDLDLVCGTGHGTTLYLASGGRFALLPAWRGPDESVSSIALGDLDGDGDLDVVYGVDGQAAKAYLNASPAFASAPDWTAPAAHTTGVALADVDGDGSLDLVRGIAAGPAELYLNSGGRLALAPWAAPSENTFGIALGDVDGDRRVDLVRGNFAQGATLYLNSGGTFADISSWVSPAENTTAVALADVDGDGRLDVVRGNSGPGSSTLYLNTGGRIDSAPAWEGPPEDTRSIALGDVDGDGKPDLVRGNSDGFSTLYLNVGSRFDSTPAWHGLPENTSSVALGDVDGDGDLDLVCGNGPLNPSTLYRNSSGHLDASPSWSGPPEDTRSVALADVDGDGRLDLVRGNFAGGTTLYMNIGSAFALAPAWTGEGGTKSVALGDVNEDGFPDVVCGNDAQASALYLHRSPWAIDATGHAPRNQLPNNPAYLRSVHVVASGSNTYHVSFQAFDLESDALTLVGEYQFQGSPVWHPMEFAGGSSRGGPFATSPVGVAHTIDWNVAGVPFDRRDVILRLHALSPAQRSGEIQFIPTYLAAAGRVRPLRPALATSLAFLVYPTLTVGDTARDALVISNPGTQVLAISQIESTNPQVSIEPTSSLVVSPGGDTSISVVLTPRQPLANYGAVRIHSNDPLKPVVDIPLVTDVRSLAVATRLVAAGDTLPLGEAATVIVTPADGVHFHSGQLHHRSKVPGETFADIPLVEQGSQWVALIPGEGVTEAGLEYYVTVENGGDTLADPAGAPDTLFSMPVAAPAAITSIAEADVSGGFPTGRPTPVTVTLPSGSQMESGDLHFRPAGASTYESVSLSVTPGQPAPSAVIPPGSVGPRGVEYWVSLNTLTRPLTDPARDPTTHPHYVPTTVASLHEDTTHAGGHYRMVTVPLELNLPGASSLADLIGGQPDFGPYDATRWRSFRWQPADSAYLEISATNIATGALSPRPGRAFWLIAKDTNRLDTAPVTGHSVSTLDSFTVELEPGWNQVGDPYDFAVEWQRASARNSSGPVILEPPVARDESADTYLPTHDPAYADTVRLRPFTGYWVFNPTPLRVVLSIPPVEAAPAAASPKPGTSSTASTRSIAPPAPRSGTSQSADSLSWELRIGAECGSASDLQNYAGVHALEAGGEDAFDRSEPPMPPGRALSLYFLDGDRPGHRRAVDIRRPLTIAGGNADRGHEWAFDVARGGDGVEPLEARLAFSGLEAVPPALRIELVDRVLERSVDLRTRAEYRYVAGRRGLVSGISDARFRLLVGAPDFVEAALGELDHRPHVSRLLPVFPNPVATAATVRFETAAAGNVTLGVFDLTGRRVRTLLEGPLDAGLHELAWHGEDDRGTGVAPGVYLLRLVTSQRSDVRKLIRIR
ncbi:MAG TPA: FG-GAP-like repeat-containing protein [Candidatus Eisenbacteria bacterium]